MFQLLFSIILSGKQGTTQQYAVDLFIDIIQFEKFQTSLIKYDCNIFNDFNNILTIFNFVF